MKKAIITGGASEIVYGIYPAFCKEEIDRAGYLIHGNVITN